MNSKNVTLDHNDMSGHEELPKISLSGTGSTAMSPHEYEMLDYNTSQPISKVLYFHRHRWLNSHICNANGMPLFYSEISNFTRKKPDVTLHRGDDDKGPIVAVARMPKCSTRTELGLGDQAGDASEVWWEEMKREQFDFSAYRWELPIRNDDKDPLQSGERRKFAWKRTHQADLGLTMRWSLWNYKLVDEETEEVFAVYAANHLKSWKKVGKIIFHKDLGKDWEIIVILTAAALLEKNRRRCRHSSGGGGGGS